jgi:hypothetical protein
MDWWPGWESIEGVSRGESFFWWLGIASLVMLATCEIISRRYGHRKDELNALALRAAAEDQQRREQEIVTRHSAEIAALRRTRDRVLPSEKARELGARLRERAGKRYWIITQSNDQAPSSEQVRLYRQLDTIFTDAGWTKSIRLFAHSTIDMPEFVGVSDRGLFIWHSQDHAAAKELAEFVAAQLEAFNIDCEISPRSNAPDDLLIIEIALR